MKKLLWIVPCLMLGLTGCSHHKKSPEAKLAKAENKISRELDLNDDQREKLKAVFAASKSLMKQDKGQRDELNKEMKELIEAPRLDKAKFKAIMVKKEKLKDAKEDQFYAEVYPKLETFHESLSTEQRKTAGECMEKHRKHWSF